MKMILQFMFALASPACLFFPGDAGAQTRYVGAPVFLGYTDQPAGTLQEVGDIAAFRKTFGTAPVAQAVGKQTDALPDFLLDHALQLFWANGGQKAHVLSTGQFSIQGKNPAAAHFTSVLRKLQNPSGPTLILMPDAVQLPLSDYMAVCKAALSHAAAYKQFVILDVQAAEKGDTPFSVAAFCMGIGTQHLSYGAAYWPYLQTQLPLSAAGNRAILPPSAAVAGNMVSNDLGKGIWKAPAGTSLRAVAAPVVAISTAENEQLTRHSIGISINAIRTFTGKGTLVWGARSLAANDRDWQYLSVRRLANHLERDVIVLTAFAASQPNNPATWQQVKAVLENRMMDLFRQGAFPGNKPEEAFFVKVGLGETMTQADLQSGRMKLFIGFAPLRPAEFVVLHIEQKAGNP